MSFDHHAHQLQAPLIHVGYPKALSSWMQKHLFKPDHRFLTILNSMESTISVINPSPFGFTEGPAMEYIRQNLDNHPQHAGLTPVISAEMLIGNPYCGGFNGKQNADRLHQLFPQGKILLIVREQKQLIRSLYKTLITWGMPHSIQRLLHPRDLSMAPQFNLEYLRFDLATHYYQTLFGTENVLVLPYEGFVRDPATFLHTLFTFAGQTPEASIPRLPVHKRVNSNQTLLNLYLQRFHNLFFLSSPFNYAGLFQSTEARTQARLRRSKRNPFPPWLNKLFENDFRQKVNVACKGEFRTSNDRLCALTGLDLTSLGYETSQATRKE
jgi:hypothetical protein